MKKIRHFIRYLKLKAKRLRVQYSLFKQALKTLNMDKEFRYPLMIFILMKIWFNEN